MARVRQLAGADHGLLPGGEQTLTMWTVGGYYNVHNITFTLETPDPIVVDLVVPGQVIRSS